VALVLGVLSCTETLGKRWPDGRYLCLAFFVCLPSAGASDVQNHEFIAK